MHSGTLWADRSIAWAIVPLYPNELTPPVCSSSAATAASCKPQLRLSTARRNCRPLLPCSYHNMRGIAKTSGAWSDLLGEQPWPKEHSDGHPIRPPLDVIMA